MYHQHSHHLPDRSCGKSAIAIPQEKWPEMISSGLTFDPNDQHIKSAKCKGRMQDVSNQGSSRLKPKRAKGDSIEIHGGRIVRSAGRKDRHSKVSTATGPRDRRVRLAPNTAIQFYDVQDRLGYDRPSKAIDWLMKEAKAAIDALDHHDSSNAITTNCNVSKIWMQPRNPLPQKVPQVQEEIASTNCSKSGSGFERQDCMDNSDTIINNFSFFSMDNGVIPPTTSAGFQTYPRFGDYSSSSSTSRNIKSQTQGLSLSFHTFQDFSFLFSSGAQQGLIIPPPSTSSHFDSETNSEIARCQMIFPWNSSSSNAKGSQESLLHPPPLHFPSHFDQNQLLFHREPLQSSFTPPIRGSLDNNQFPNLCFSGTRFSRDDHEGLSDLSAAAIIQCQEEQNPVSNKPSSATSLLHYQG